MRTEKELLELCLGSVDTMIENAAVDPNGMCEVDYANLIELATMLNILQQS